MDRGHVHTGFVSFLFAGISAVVFIHLTRMAAAQLAANDSTAALGNALGGFVTFGGTR